MTELNVQSCRSSHRENIPWYLNGTLADDEQVALDEHLKSCGACRSDVQMHAAMRESVLGRDVAPLVPKVSSAQLLQRDDSVAATAASKAPQRWIAIAAGVAALGAALVMSFYAGQGLNNNDHAFETATSAGASVNIDYVLQVRFSDTALLQEQSQIAATLPGATKWNVNGAGAYEIHVQLSSPTLAMLQEYENRVREIEGVESAKFTALQLPIK